MWMLMYSGVGRREFVYMFPMSAIDIRAPSVEMVLLTQILNVSRLETSVPASPS